MGSPSPSEPLLGKPSPSMQGSHSEATSSARVSRAERQKIRSKLRRRATQRQAQGVEDSQRHSRVKGVAKRRRAVGTPLKVDVGVGEASTIGGHGVPADSVPFDVLVGLASRVSEHGFTGKRLTTVENQKAPLTKEEALKLGFRYVEWNGIDCVPLLDKQDRVFAVLAGSPKDQLAWAKVNKAVTDAFDEVRMKYKFNQKQVDHRRGNFPAVSAGISYGGGQTRVQNLTHPADNQLLIDGLLANKAVQRVAKFGDAAMRLFAPRLHTYYEETMQKLISNSPIKLTRNFDDNAFASAAFNLGPRVSTCEHTDHLNIPAGWCAIIAMGDFDPRESGHVILWDLELIVEFPPGATILIPSAMLRHSNTMVRPHERRYSFTQYSAGGLFRWVECGFKPQKVFMGTGNRYELTGEERWAQGVGLFSTWQELQGDMI
ncbi:hypothetical protein OH77DRAFT_1486440 [Trametes cingulata]|nr:hypothetical protein OH77DRAFT_1486440 [Trametes cingulata]